MPEPAETRPQFPDLYGDSLLAEILARDTACGPDYRMLNADRVDRRILLHKLADAYRELDLALAESERRDGRPSRRTP